MPQFLWVAESMWSTLAVALDTLTHICPCGSNSTLPPGRRCILARKILTLQVTALLPLKCGTWKSAALLGVDTRPDAAVWGYGEVVGLISAGDGSVWPSTTSIRGQSDVEIFKVVLVWSGKNAIPPEYSSWSHTLLSWSWKKSRSYHSCRDRLQPSTHSQNTWGKLPLEWCILHVLSLHIFQPVLADKLSLSCPLWRVAASRKWL